MATTTTPPLKGKASLKGKVAPKGKTALNGKTANRRRASTKGLSNERYRLVGTYERLRRALSELPPDGRLDKELSYWVLPTDRRLPIAFLDRTLSELLGLPLEELMATPGVGQKKIIGFFDLLRRVAKAGANEEPFGLPGDKHSPADSRTGDSADALARHAADRLAFDAATVSEAMWETWCESIRRNDLGDQPLGRLAPSLQTLPTVIWHTPLAAYLDMSLAKMRRLKTHGEKRVQAILEVFGAAHEAISTAALHENLDLDLTPRFVPRLTRWLTEAAWKVGLPPADVLHERLVQPLVRQIEIDLGEQVAGLATDRLRLDSRAPSVKQQSEALGVTRARVYQLLDDCGKVMDVRWPEGRWLLAPLASKYEAATPQAIGLLHGVRDLFYPEERPARHVTPTTA